MANSILPTDDKARFWKYMSLLADAGALVLLDQFNSRIPTVGLAKCLNNKKAQLTILYHQTKIIKKDQYDLLFPQSGQPDASKFDVTLLLFLMKNLYGVKDPQLPLAPSDTSIEADIYRVRDIRNKQAHTTKTAMTEPDLHTKWDELKQFESVKLVSSLDKDVKSKALGKNFIVKHSTILLRLGAGISDLEDRIDELKEAAIEPAREKELQAIKESWKDMQEELFDAVEDLAKQNKKLEEDVEELKGSTKKLKQDVNKVEETMKELEIPPRLKSLITSSKDFLEDCESDEVYFKTEAHEKARNVLSKGNCLVISGQPGEGKTTMAKKLVMELSAPEKCLVLEDPENWEHVDTDKVPIEYLVMDDIFGAGAMDSRLAKTWELYLKRIQRRITKTNFKVIITTRHYILEEAKLVGKYGAFFKKENVVHLRSKDLSKDEREHILSAHLRKSKREFDWNLIYSCIDISDSFFIHFMSKSRDFAFGFPQCVDMFVNSDELFDKGSDFFSNPKSFYMDVLEDLKRDPEREKFLALILTWAREGRPIHRSELSWPSSSDELEQIAQMFGFSLKTYETLSKVLKFLDHHKDDIFYYKPSSGSYTFSHNVIKDMVGLALCKEYPEKILKYSSRDFIIEYVTVEEENENSKFHFYVEEYLYTKLTQRLIELLPVKSVSKGINFRHLRKGGRCPNKVVPTLKIDVGMTDIDAFKKKNFVSVFVNYAGTECDNLFQTSVMTMSGYFLGRGITTDDVEICLPDYCLLNGNEMLLAEIMKRDVRCGTSSSVEQLDISLTIAVHLGLEETVTRLLRAGAIVTQETVYIAAVQKRNDLVKMLMGKDNALGTSRIFRIVKGNSPLIISAKKGLLDTVRCLVKQGADTNYRNDSGFCALDKAVLFGHTDVCKVLLNESSPINERHGEFKRTPLHVASDTGSVEIVRLLLQHGSQVDLKDHRGHYPIHCAAFQGHTGVVEVLLQHDLSLANQRIISYGKNSVIRGMTVYHIAVWKNKQDLMEMLVKSGSKPSVADCFGRTPLYCAAFDGKKQLVKLLLPHSNPNSADKQGRTPLHAALIKDHESIAQLLCPHTNVNATDRSGVTPLHEACKRGQVDTALELIQTHRADYIIRDKKGRSAYDVAQAPVKSAIKAFMTF